MRQWGDYSEFGVFSQEQRGDFTTLPPKFAKSTHFCVCVCSSRFFQRTLLPPFRPWPSLSHPPQGNPSNPSNPSRRKISTRIARIARIDFPKSIIAIIGFQKVNNWVSGQSEQSEHPKSPIMDFESQFLQKTHFKFEQSESFRDQSPLRAIRVPRAIRVDPGSAN